MRLKLSPGCFLERIVLAAVMLVVAGIASAEPQVIGTLTATKRVIVIPEGAEQGVTITDDNYVWFSGDRIQTFEGTSGLVNLEGKGTIYVGAESLVSIDLEEGVYVIRLLDGAGLAFRFNDGVQFQVHIKDQIIEPKPDGSATEYGVES